MRPGWVMTYEDYVGIVLNRGRILTQRAVAVLAAINASGDDDLDASWADAVAEDATEIEEILGEANRQRAQNRSRRRRGAGGSFGR